MKSTLILSMVALACQNAGAGLITLNFDSQIPENQQLVIQQAANFWNTVITGYDAQYEYGPDLSEAAEITPHSLAIHLSLATDSAIGGADALATSSPPLYYDDNNVGDATNAFYYSVTGKIEFNVSSIDSLDSSLLYRVALHEMAHVLGFGLLWNFTDYRGFDNPTINGAVVDLYDGADQYKGPAALAAWKAEFDQNSATYVPVEIGGGLGTANLHWNESDDGMTLTGIKTTYNGVEYDLSQELMTGWFKAGDPVFLSRTTLGAIDDLGYQVNYSMAGLIPEPSVFSWVLLCAGFLLRRRR